MTDDFTGVQKRQNPIEGFFQRTSIKTNPFSGNRSAERAYARTERIVAAIHLLTNHIDTNEPLRTAVRARSLALLEDVLAIRDEMRSQESSEIVSLRTSIRLLISHLRMMVASGFVSHQNADMVIESIDELGNFVASSQRSTLSETISLVREDFDPPRSSIGQHVQHRGLIKDIKDRDVVKDNSDLKDTQGVSFSSKLEGNITDRKQGILEILRSGGQFSIRDISSNVPQYSEKMVQRELAELVALGLVKKTGLKRWSRYSLLETVKN